jgi:hypothetical protein
MLACVVHEDQRPTPTTRRKTRLTGATMYLQQFLARLERTRRPRSRRGAR